MSKMNAAYKKVDLFAEPEKIMDTLPPEMRMAEMSEAQHGFLCGLIKEYRPKKILEVGVYAGGTTAIMMNCLHILGLEPEFYSLDLNTTYYSTLDETKTIEIGFVAQYVKTQLDYKNYTLITGDVLAAHIDDIGDGVDFLILDTTHCMPGEILEFLVSFPYLSKNAVIVLHDMILNHYSESYEAYATRVLFDAVTAEKFYMMGGYDKNPDDLFNIAAFQVNDESRTHIRDVFSSLAYTWAYMPSEEQLGKYMTIIEKHYDEYTVDWMKMIISVQKRTSMNWERDNFIRIKTISRIKESTNGVVIYGCGHLGEVWYESLRERNIKICAFVVSDDQPITKENVFKFPVPIYHLKELPYEYKDSLFIPAVWNKNICDEISKALQNNGYTNILF